MYSSSILSYDNKLALSDIILIRHNIPDIIAAGCPFCMTMLSDGVKHFEKENEVQVLDLAEITAKANGLS
jgi:Fe-S oxidoreductase